MRTFTKYLVFTKINWSNVFGNFVLIVHSINSSPTPRFSDLPTVLFEAVKIRFKMHCDCCSFQTEKGEAICHSSILEWDFHKIIANSCKIDDNPDPPKYSKMASKNNISKSLYGASLFLVN